MIPIHRYQKNTNFKNVPKLNSFICNKSVSRRKTYTDEYRELVNKFRVKALVQKSIIIKYTFLANESGEKLQAAFII